jgi:hypothetical protein
VFSPVDAKFNTKMATRGEISIIPIGGMIFRKGARYGSQIFVKNRPIAVSRAFGNHDINI